jgi:hypothetical protein
MWVHIGENHAHYPTGKKEVARTCVRVKYDIALYPNFTQTDTFSQAEQRKNDVRVTPCDKTNTSAWWCCGDSDACCTDTSLAKYRVDPVFVGADTSSSMPSSTTTSPTAGSSTASATATPPNDDSGSLSTGAKAGIGVGAALGVIALIALGVFIGRRTHKKRKDIREGAGYYEPAKEALPPAYKYEAPVEQGPVELAGDQIQPQEAPDHGHGR